MSCFKIASLCGAVLIMSTTPAIAKGEPKPAQKEQSQPTQQQRQATKARYSLDEESVVLLFDEPDEHLVKARNSLARKDAKDAARELRKTIVFLKLEADRAEGDNEKAIRASVQDFEKFLNDMEKGAMSVSIRKVAESLKQDALKVSGDSAKALQLSSAELEKLADQMEEKAPQASGNDVIDPIAARAHVALVKHHVDKAKDYWGRKDTRRTAGDLEASADHLARAYQWLNKDADGATKSAFKDARSLATRLLQNTSVSNEEFTKVSDIIAKEFERAGKLTESQKK